MVLKQTIPLILKICFVLIFSGLLVYWAWAAISKYINQPVSTFSSYTQGDDDTHVILPDVTFCDTNFIENNKVLQECNKPLDSNSYSLLMLSGQDTSKNELTFLSTIRNCLKNGINFTMNDYLKSLEEARLNDFITNHDMTETTFNRSFYTKYDLNYGLCVAFDARKVEMKVDDPDTDLFLGLNVQSRVESIKKEESSILAMLHTRTDYPDACSYHPCFKLKRGFIHHMSLKKIIISRDSTRKSKCTQYNRKTCQEIKSNRKIMDNFKCKLMFLDTGSHLEQLIEGYVDLPICSNSSVMEEAIDIVENTMDDDECNKEVSCQRTKFDIYTSGELGGELARTYFWLKFHDLEVEHIVTYISYDTQSLICELGGVLGMFLGLSGVSIGYYFVDMIERHLLHKKSPLSKSLMERFRRLRRRGGKNVKNGKTIWMIISAFSIALLVLLIFLATILPSVNVKLNSHHLTTTMSSTVQPTTSTTTNVRTCYTGYEDKASFISSINGHCYYAEKELKSFNFALANCKALFGMEAILAEPKDSDENHDLHDWAVDYLTDQFYIGVTHIQFSNLSGGIFTYQSSGQPISYQNWANNEPGPPSIWGSCVEMFSYGEWGNIDCSLQRASICQYSTSSPPPM